MKKIFSIFLCAVVISVPMTALASNHVSDMAKTKGGKHIAECAKKMDKGISKCTKMVECEMGM